MAKKAVRVFLDSNVILSGLLSDTGAPRIILDILCLRIPFIIGVTGRYNIIEIDRNLTKKMPEVLPVYKDYLPKLNLEIIPLPSEKDVKKYSGHVSDKNVPVLVSAVKGKADFLVTGDQKDFARLKVKSNYPFKILSPSEFLDIIPSEILRCLGE
jgi:predicted nucleic acid-binding protein